MVKDGAFFSAKTGRCPEKGGIYILTTATKILNETIRSREMKEAELKKALLLLRNNIAKGMVDNSTITYKTNKLSLAIEDVKKDLFALYVARDDPDVNLVL